MNFDELNLAPAILKAVREQGYDTPTRRVPGRLRQKPPRPDPTLPGGGASVARE